MTIARTAPARPRFLSLEITGRCQLTCPSLCYAGSGPTRGHGSMSDGDWFRTIDQAVALGAEEVQLIGGEPTLHPGFASIAQHALDAGLRVRVHSNLLRISAEHWQAVEQPGARLATTYRSSVAAEHDEVTARRGHHTATRANIIEAVRRCIALKVAVLDAGDPARAPSGPGRSWRPSVFATSTSGRCGRSATPWAPRCGPRRSCAGGAGTNGPWSCRAGRWRSARSGAS
ncbi:MULTISPECIES: radical SAM protein [unclassified Streptomyces]|uniref:radical SAM protein n=1 Tax=unclassified Streptomyces TaxID=2593676 RepID=UPI002ED41380|nr:radical SAM protein [Streptomyces sp. NBC_00891]WSY09554.1 radical SAM protein [Streptomyces sp. NBC_00890]WSZ11174.1 radical SAM protein [Streptomyces sp. NBC_00869]WSZ21320.1 radical SAM protein [Streptomyces sp. NBC_00870]